MKYYNIVLILMFALMIMPMASSKLLASTSSGDLEIIAPGWDYIEQGQDVDFFWHVYNSTAYKTNATTNCTFHLYSIAEDGEHIIAINNVPIFSNDRDFEVEVDGSNFTTLGSYRDVIECITISGLKQVGSRLGEFEVTPNGQAPEDNSFAIIVGICLLAIILILIAGYWESMHWVMKVLFMMFALYLASFAMSIIVQMSDGLPSIWGILTNIDKLQTLFVVIMWVTISYLFIFYTIQLFQVLKNSGKKMTEVDKADEF